MAAYDATVFPETAPFFEGHHSPHHAALFFGETMPVRPTVAVTPAPIVTNQASTIEITASADIERVIVFVEYPTLPGVEVAFHGNAFTPDFSGQSTIVAITNGYRLTLRRNTGWPESPKVYVHANTDKGGVNAA